MLLLEALLQSRNSSVVLLPSVLERCVCRLSLPSNGLSELPISSSKLFLPALLSLLQRTVQSLLVLLCRIQLRSGCLELRSSLRQLLLDGIALFCQRLTHPQHSLTGCILLLLSSSFNRFLVLSLQTLDFIGVLGP